MSDPSRMVVFGQFVTLRALRSVEVVTMTSRRCCRENRSRAFSLVELLVVIAIILVVAAIIFPVFIAVKGSARASACESNEHQISLAALHYATDNDDHFPFDISGSNLWLERVGLTSPKIIKGKFEIYIPTLICPDLQRPSDTAPADPGYAYNACVGSKMPESPSRTVMVAESTFYHPIGRPDVLISADLLDMPDSYYADRRRWVLDSFGSRYEPYDRWGALRHNGMGNYVFFDGSVRRLPPEAFRIPLAFETCSIASSWIGPPNGPTFVAVREP